MNNFTDFEPVVLIEVPLWVHVVDFSKLIVVLMIMITVKYYWLRFIENLRNNRMQMNDRNVLDALRFMDRQGADEEEDEQQQNRLTNRHVMVLVQNFDPSKPIAIGDGTPEFFIWQQFFRTERRRQREIDRQTRIRRERLEDANLAARGRA